MEKESSLFYTVLRQVVLHPGVYVAAQTFRLPQLTEEVGHRDRHLPCHLPVGSQEQLLLPENPGVVSQGSDNLLKAGLRVNFQACGTAHVTGLHSTTCSLIS
uniref:Uncharacterized protein n=1 Tax=Anguilla anguilla TaxID=7936 RepID=A0A0E9S161_ANGAN